MNSLRLNKALASAGVCSRRAADDLIRAGAVCVNGALVAEPGIRVNPGADSVTVHGQPVSLTASEEIGHSYIMLHKPVQVVSTVKDPQGRTTVLELLPASLRAKRLYPVGRLDYFSEGLLLLTDDGELTNRLTHPRYHLPKMYEVRVRETPTGDMLEAMRRGMRLREGEKLAPVEVRLAKESRNTMLLTLRQGINRQIRRMCRDLGLTILTLRRISIGPLHLGDLAKGQCRSLRDSEIASLKRAVTL